MGYVRCVTDPPNGHQGQHPLQRCGCVASHGSRAAWRLLGKGVIQGAQGESVALRFGRLAGGAWAARLRKVVLPVQQALAAGGKLALPMQRWLSLSE